MTSIQFTQRAVLLPESFTVGDSIEFIRQHQQLFSETPDVTPLEILYIKRGNGSLGAFCNELSVCLFRYRFFAAFMLRSALSFLFPR